MMFSYDAVKDRPTLLLAMTGLTQPEFEAGLPAKVGQQRINYALFLSEIPAFSCHIFVVRVVTVHHNGTQIYDRNSRHQGRSDDKSTSTLPGHFCFFSTTHSGDRPRGGGGDRHVKKCCTPSETGPRPSESTS